MRFIDSHVHLADFADPGQVVSFARSVGGILVSVGIDESSSARSISLHRSYPDVVRAFVGVHPSEAVKERNAGWLEKAVSGAAGVGEIGLDPKYSEVGRGTPQMELFREQLSVAEKWGKPVQVHSRGAESECLEELSTFRLEAVLLHWFQGEDHMKEADCEGRYISFGPALLVSKKLQRMAISWGRNRILVESDGPVSFAALGGASGSTLIPSVVFKLAQLLHEPFEDARRLVSDNALAFLSEKA